MIHHRLTKALFPVLAAMMVAACSRQITLDDVLLNVRLRYSCSNPRPQAESREEIRVVMQYAARAVRHAAANERIASARAIGDAARAQQFAIAERATVEYLCRYDLDPRSLDQF